MDNFTTLDYETNLDNSQIAQLREQIRLKCQCQVKHNESKKTFILTNTKHPSADFMHIKGIMGFSRNVKGANKGGYSTTQSDQSQISTELQLQRQTEDSGEPSNAQEYSMNTGKPHRLG